MSSYPDEEPQSSPTNSISPEVTIDKELAVVASASAREQRALEIRAALLLLLMAVLVAAMVLYLMWARGVFEATQRLYLTTDDSDGVSVGMDMTFSGFPIGRVRDIELAKEGTVRIAVDVPVKDAHWLRTSSVFTLEKGIVGTAKLRAFSGSMQDPPLPKDAERKVLRSDVSAEIPRMVADARDVLQNVGYLTAGQSALSHILNELRIFTKNVNSNQGGLVGALTGNQADAKRMGELIARTSELMESLSTVVARTDAILKKADKQVLGPKGLMTDAQATVQDFHGLLKQVRQSMVRVDAVLQDVQVVAGNTREATTDLSSLRADVESSLSKVDALITELNRKWPFAPKQKEVTLP